MPLRAHGLLLLSALLALSLALWGADTDVLWALRLPRVLAGFGVGALLALAGLAMQILLRNPLADPYVLGTSSGAAVGAVAALLLFEGLMWAGAALGALLAGGLLVLLARGLWGDGRIWASFFEICSRSLRFRRGAMTPGQQSPHRPLLDDDASARLILTGAMLAALLGAVLSLMLSVTPDARLRGAIFWLLGDVSAITDTSHSLALIALAAVLAALCAWRGKSLDRLLLGSEAAALLGEPVLALRRALLLGACVATASAVSTAGTIGFVGLVVPQALRLCGLRHTASLAWASAVGGGTLLVLADGLARQVAYPLELPVGAVMALLGAPVFMALLYKHR
jgi:iron complex transport system permease protein